ncbi:MAG: NAD+ synthase [Acidobacteria bacterium]|nr:NAD+ synthase [Acidobacteriota bacterium]
MSSPSIEPASAAFSGFNAPLASRALVVLIHDEVTKVGFQRALIGLSGGIDSAVVAFLAAQALGPRNTFCVMMPYRTSTPASVRDAEAVIQTLGVEGLKIDISPMVDAYLETSPGTDRIRSGNVMARVRMMVLFDQSAAHQALVLGTSNKTELLVGYGTLFGDMASAVAPIGDLYKTEVRSLAKHLGVPSSILEKPPTADLWEGQSDEAELGLTYDELDRILVEVVDKRIPLDEMSERGFDPSQVERVMNMIRSTQFKRRSPIIPKISTRSVNHDFLYKRDWGK